MVLVRVLFDALTAADTRQVMLLGLLDMSAAFDCVDHYCNDSRGTSEYRVLPSSG